MTDMKCKDESARMERSARMIGEDGLRRLSEARVAVFGLGGVGSSCVEALIIDNLGYSWRVHPLLGFHKQRTL